VFVPKMTKNSANVEKGRRSYACTIRSVDHGDERVSQLESDFQSLRSNLNRINAKNSTGGIELLGPSKTAGIRGTFHKIQIGFYRRRFRPVHRVLIRARVV